MGLFYVDKYEFYVILMVDFGSMKERKFSCVTRAGHTFYFKGRNLVVRTTLRAVADRFAAKPAEAKPTRRLIIIIRLVDGDWVLEKEHDPHQPRHRYKDEAKSIVRGLFSPRVQEEKFCSKRKADTLLHEVLGFRRTSDIEAKSHFERDGIEWHPVMLQLDCYGFDSSFIKKRAKLKSRTLSRIAEHKYAEKLLKIFPRERDNLPT